MIANDERAVRWILGCAFTAAVLLASCATTSDSTSSGVMGSGAGVTASDPTRMTQSGFLTDYKRLQPATWSDGIQCWRDPKVDAAKYDKVLIARMIVTLKDSEANGVDPTDLKMLTDYFRDSLAKALRPQMPVVDSAGEGVIVIRIALTDLVPTSVARSVTGTAIPFGFVAEAGSGVATGRPAGATPYMGQAGMEMQVLDGASGAILGECRDSEVGRKYAADLNAGATGAAQTWASGYANSFQSWSYAKNAFDKWSLLTARRFAELRGVKASPK